MDKSIQQQTKSLLSQCEYTQLLDICDTDRRYWKALRSIVKEDDIILSWPAIEVVALLMQRWWLAGNTDRVVEYIRRLFWSINDESGEIGWNAPAIVAEIIMAIPELLIPNGSIMISRALEEPPLIKSGLWGIGRLGTQVTESIERYQDLLLATFKIDDPEILGLAAWAVGESHFSLALPNVERLKGRQEMVQIYIDGQFVEKPLGQWAEEAIEKIKNK